MDILRRQSGVRVPVSDFLVLDTIFCFVFFFCLAIMDSFFPVKANPANKTCGGTIT